jgi:glutathione S-transferase
MKLYGFPPSPNTSKILAFAKEVDVPLELVFVDISKGGARTPEFLRLNPAAKTPVLVDGDLVLRESNAILTYLAERAPNAFYPEDAAGRALVAQWQSWSLSHWGPPSRTLVFERLLKAMFALGPADEVAVGVALKQFATEARLLDDHLAASAYLVRGKLTVADFECASSLVYAEAAGLPVADYPNVAAWYGRIAARPSWAATAPKPN